MRLPSLLIVLSLWIVTSLGNLAQAAQSVATASPEKALTVSSVHVTHAPGGAYITGSIRPSFGFTAPVASYVRVTVYDLQGNVLTTKIDQVNRNQLVRSHSRSRPRATYGVFVPWSPSEISRTTVIPFSGLSP